MDTRILSELIKLSAGQEAQQRTVEYLAHHLKALIKEGDKVIICFQEHKEGNLSDLFFRAVHRVGGTPLQLGPDKRWKSLLQQSFFSRASTIIGPPLVILGLAKLKKQSGLPLYIRHAVMAGHPIPQWIADGVQQGLDCTAWGCVSVGTTGVVAGFSCRSGSCFHLRDDVYGMDIVDGNGVSLPSGSLGEMVIYPKTDPNLRYGMGEEGRLLSRKCDCGCTDLRIVDMAPGSNEDLQLVWLGQELIQWTSVLDVRLAKGEYGLEIEMVVFPGEKLPKLPTAAKQVIRPWDPKHDEPFFYKPKGSR